MFLPALLLVGLIPAAQVRSISTTEREAIWNNFKYHNVFVRWTMTAPSETGVIVQGDDAQFVDPMFLIKVSIHNMLNIVLPLNDGNVSLSTIQIPETEYPFQIVLTIAGDELLVVTSRCQIIIHEKMHDVDFRMTTPEITLGSLPHFYENIQVSSGNPISQFCSVLKHQRWPTTKERIENKRRKPTPSKEMTSGNATCWREGRPYAVGNKLTTSGCDKCVCVSGGTFDCEHPSCVPLENCSYPFHEAGSCCPSRCSRECEFNGIFHHHGSVFWPETCIRCECNDGSVHCKFNHEHMCPALPCPVNQQMKKTGQCCASCVNFDYCSVNPCHEDATCISSEEGAQCRCKEGFFGNGTYCYDIDECRFAWSVQEQLGGCTGSICVNTKGSFRCDCLPGHPRIDEHTCLNLIRI